MTHLDYPSTTISLHLSSFPIITDGKVIKIAKRLARKSNNVADDFTVMAVVKAGNVKAASLTSAAVVEAARSAGDTSVRCRLKHGDKASHDAVVAQSSGISPRSARRERSRVEALGEFVLASLRAKRLNDTQLDALIGIEPVRRADIIARALAGEVVNPVSIVGQLAIAARDAANDPVLLFLASWDALNRDQQFRFGAILNRRNDEQSPQPYEDMAPSLKEHDMIEIGFTNVASTFGVELTNCGKRISPPPSDSNAYKFGSHRRGATLDTES